MKTLYATVAALALLTGPALAFGNVDTTINTNTNVQGQAQGQQQGQVQGQQQSAKQANSQSMKVDGTATAPGIGGCDFGISAGVVGYSAGICVPTITGNSVKVARLYIDAGANAKAIAILDNTPVAKRAFRSNPAVVAATAPRATKAAYVSCGKDANGAIRAKVPHGSSAAVKQLAASQCRAAVK